MTYKTMSFDGLDAVQGNRITEGMRCKMSMHFGGDFFEHGGGPSSDFVHVITMPCLSWERTRMEQGISMPYKFTKTQNGIEGHGYSDIVIACAGGNTFTGFNTGCKSSEMSASVVPVAQTNRCDNDKDMYRFQESTFCVPKDYTGCTTFKVISAMNDVGQINYLTFINPDDIKGDVKFQSKAYFYRDINAYTKPLVPLFITKDNDKANHRILDYFMGYNKEVNKDFTKVNEENIYHIQMARSEGYRSVADTSSLDGTSSSKVTYGLSNSCDKISKSSSKADKAADELPNYIGLVDCSFLNDAEKLNGKIYPFATGKRGNDIKDQLTHKLGVKAPFKQGTKSDFTVKQNECFQAKLMFNGNPKDSTEMPYKTKITDYTIELSKRSKESESFWKGEKKTWGDVPKDDVRLKAPSIHVHNLIKKGSLSVEEFVKNTCYTDVCTALCSPKELTKGEVSGYDCITGVQTIYHIMDRTDMPHDEL